MWPFHPVLCEGRQYLYVLFSLNVTKYPMLISRETCPEKLRQGQEDRYRQVSTGTQETPRGLP